MKKVAIIIPGFGYSGKEKEYKKVAGFFAAKGIAPVVADIRWKRRTFSEYLAQFDDEYGKYFKNNKEVYVLGFSFGAMMSSVISSRHKSKVLMLCSLSPYFKEDLPRIKKWWKSWIGKGRLEEFKKLSFTNLAKNIKCKTFILAGNKEGPEVGYRAKDALKKIKNSKLIFIEGVKHDISDSRYLAKIKKVIISDWK